LKFYPFYHKNVQIATLCWRQCNVTVYPFKLGTAIDHSRRITRQNSKVKVKGKVLKCAITQ